MKQATIWLINTMHLWVRKSYWISIDYNNITFVNIWTPLIIISICFDSFDVYLNLHHPLHELGHRRSLQSSCGTLGSYRVSSENELLSEIYQHCCHIHFLGCQVLSYYTWYCTMYYIWYNKLSDIHFLKRSVCIANGRNIHQRRIS